MVRELSGLFVVTLCGFQRVSVGAWSCGEGLKAGLRGFHEEFMVPGGYTAHPQIRIIPFGGVGEDM